MVLFLMEVNGRNFDHMVVYPEIALTRLADKIHSKIDLMQYMMSRISKNPDDIKDYAKKLEMDEEEITDRINRLNVDNFDFDFVLKIVSGLVSTDFIEIIP